MTFRIPIASGGVALLVCAVVTLSVPAPTRGQGPGPVSHAGDLHPDTLHPDTLHPDTLRPDTLRSDTVRPATVPGDTLRMDTLRIDTLLADTLEVVEGDTVRQVLPRNLPTFPGGAPVGMEAGVWEWDREGLLGSEALTLHDLLTHVTGVIRLRGGDYGTPVAVTTAGFGPGQIRVFRDGIEDPPQEGGVLDLAQVGLAGLESVRVERRPAELRIHLTTLQLTDSRPYTLLDVGTGDLRTNLFRATFAHPSVLGGTLLVALDRLDTEGDGPDNEGAAFGTRLRYTFFQGDRGGVAVDYRARTARRPDDVFQPREVTRSDWTLQGRWLLREDLVGEAFVTTSRVDRGDEALPAADTLLPLGSRREAGMRLGTALGPGWLQAQAGIRGGQGWPGSVVGLEAGADRDGLGGFTAGWDRERWRGGESGHTLSARAWTESWRGVSLFGEVQDLRRGVPFLVPRPLPEEEDPENGGGEEPPPPPVEEPDPEDVPGVRFSERSGARVGARARWRGLDVSAAYLVTEADSLAPMGLPFDRDGLTFPGGRRTGFEVAGRLPLDRVLGGLQVQGHGQFWDAGAWRYHPNRSWLGALSWRHLGYDSNLEIWTDVGVRGRDSMIIPLIPDPQDGSFFEAPSNLSWFARLQIRVVTVRLFVHWENFAVKDDNLEFPGRPQPRTRALYGIRWTLWN